MSSGPWRRFAVLVGWLLASAIGLLILTQAFGINGNKYLASMHALTPYLAFWTAPLAAIACWRQAHRLAVTASLIGLGALILASPLVIAPDHPDPDTAATGTTVATVNLLYRNPVVGELADELLRQDADVIVFSEYTIEHQQDLLAHPLASTYAYKIDRDGLFAGGVAVWSRFPIVEGERLDTANYTLDVVMESPDGPIRLLGVHPPTPIFDFDLWLSDLETFGDVGASSTQPTLITGDFNASYWHPSFRALLRRGFVDAHTAHGQAFSTSWPTDKWFPAFVQLDHALTANGLVSTHVEDFDAPGSDHRGLLVTVAPTR